MHERALVERPVVEFPRLLDSCGLVKGEEKASLFFKAQMLGRPLLRNGRWQPLVRGPIKLSTWSGEPLRLVSCFSLGEPIAII